MVLDLTVRYRNVFSAHAHDGTKMGASCLISCDYSMQMDGGAIPCRWYSDVLRKSKSRSHDQSSESQMDLTREKYDGDRQIIIFLSFHSTCDLNHPSFLPSLSR
jgi:hypothetical protein